MTIEDGPGKRYTNMADSFRTLLLVAKKQIRRLPRRPSPHPPKILIRRNPSISQDACLADAISICPSG
ncbi:hypothetical protein VTN02DRAFT_3550 [Thermoascus thermophilus]